MARSKGVKIDTLGKHRCLNCGDWFDDLGFYKYQHELFKATGLLPICKNCVLKEYERLYEIYNSERTALYNLCAKLNIPFHSKVYEGAAITAQKKNMKTFQAYFSKLNSFGEKNGYGTIFIDGEFLDENYNITEKKINTYEEELSEVDIETIKYWGKGKELWEYHFLENEMFNIKSSFECPDYGMEMIMKDICLINLDIENVRQGNGSAKNDILKLIETRSKLMNDANMKPVQSTGAEANDQVTFGTLIKKWENEKPIRIVLDDEMKKYIDTYMVGHLAKMQGLNGEIIDKYEESLKEYDIDFDTTLNNEDDD